MMPAMNAFFGSAVNITPVGNIYPTASASLGQIGGAATPYTTDPASAAASTSGDPSNAAPAMTPKGLFGEPLTWWVTIIVLFLALGFIAKKAGQAGEFSNIRLSGYNILTITLAAIIGIAAFKILFTRVQVPGLSALIQAL